jgi:hypothetical protein
VAVVVQAVELGLLDKEIQEVTTGLITPAVAVVVEIKGQDLTSLLSRLVRPVAQV